MPEAMNQIRKELGKDAVILHSKEILQGGFLGFFKKKNIEVVAALDPQPLREKNKSKSNEEIVGPLNQQSQMYDKNQEVLQEIKKLKKMMEVQTGQIEQKFPQAFQVAYEHLLEQEVDSEISEDVIRTAQEQFDDSVEEQSTDSIMNAVEKTIEDKLTTIASHGMVYEKKVIQFVGPTGVGKTTTIAKVAARMILEEKMKIAFITTDTYRIGAVEQLKTYARILDVPLEVAYSIQDYYLAIDKFTSYDLILVDTAGRNYRDKKYVQELKTTINMDMMDTYLVLSLTTKAIDNMQIFNQFKHLSIRQVIFTKLDETSLYGSVLNISLANQMGIACITNGQDVPEDIMDVKPDKISSLLVGEHSEI